MDDFLELEGWVIYGCPWVPTIGFGSAWAFMLDRGDPLRSKYAPILAARSVESAGTRPPIDILMTHGPPHMILDTLTNGEHVGSEELRDVVMVAKPTVHCSEKGAEGKKFFMLGFAFLDDDMA
ncbi:hypothetical protein HDU93_007945 [Gonapodya sp. JEL0774]|nr:hypothetical protein HDU93_007945 [Gonapodya sp. JEL0774]